MHEVKTKRNSARVKNAEGKYVNIFINTIVTAKNGKDRKGIIKDIYGDIYVYPYLVSRLCKDYPLHNLLAINQSCVINLINISQELKHHFSYNYIMMCDGIKQIPSKELIKLVRRIYKALKVKCRSWREFIQNILSDINLIIKGAAKLSVIIAAVGKE